MFFLTRIISEILRLSIKPEIMSKGFIHLGVICGVMHERFCEIDLTSRQVVYIGDNF